VPGFLFLRVRAPRPLRSRATRAPTVSHDTPPHAQAFENAAAR